MQKVNEILQNKLFITTINKIDEYERNRIFCKHDIDHLLHVARISYIINLENNYNLSKELIYASALLHDIGRAAQYENEVSHRVAGVDIAEKILSDIDFSKEYKEQIINVIKNHGKSDDILCSIISIADNKSRNCFLCNAKEQCNWEETRRNKNIIL